MNINKFVIGQEVRFSVIEDGKKITLKGEVQDYLQTPKGYVYDIIVGDGFHENIAEGNIRDADGRDEVKAVYTIIAIFGVGKYTDETDCWVVNFRRKEDAVKAFEFKLNKCGAIKDGYVTIEDGITSTVADTFDELAENGYALNTDDGKGKTRWFIRKEPLLEEFNEDNVAW